MPETVAGILQPGAAGLRGAERQELLLRRLRGPALRHDTEDGAQGADRRGVLRGEEVRGGEAERVHQGLRVHGLDQGDVEAVTCFNYWNRASVQFYGNRTISTLNMHMLV